MVAVAEMTIMTMTILSILLMKIILMVKSTTLSNSTNAYGLTGLYHLGNYKAAITYFDKALAMNPSVYLLPPTLTVKGLSLSSLRNYTGAIDYYYKALAINRDGGYGPGGCGWGNCGNYGGQPVCGAFCAGEQDAQFDLQNNLQYNPIGQCIPCHSDEYWTNFHEGYDHQWNTYQSQESNQGSSINIYGNNNYVSTNRYSNQQQNPLQQLAQRLGSLITR